MKRIFLLLAGSVTLFTLMAAPVQSTEPATPTPQMQAQSEVQTFMGTILKNGENFAGRTVKVTGTLDLDNNLIHVETIENII
jgi:hypothetical protein